MTKPKPEQDPFEWACNLIDGKNLSGPSLESAPIGDAMAAISIVAREITKVAKQLKNEQDGKAKT